MFLDSIQNIKDLAIISFFVIFGMNYFINAIYKEQLNRSNIIKENLVQFDDTIDLLFSFIYNAFMFFMIGLVFYLITILTREDIGLLFQRIFSREDVCMGICFIIFSINIILVTKEIKRNKYIKLLNKLIPFLYGLFVVSNSIVMRIDTDKSNRHASIYFIITFIICYYLYFISESYEKTTLEMKLRKEQRYLFYLDEDEDLYGNILWQDEVFYLIADEKDGSKRYMNKSYIQMIVQDKLTDSSDKMSKCIKEGDRDISYPEKCKRKARRNLMELLMKYKKQILLAIFIIIATVLIPVLIDYLIIGNNMYSNIKNEDWVGFLGGYIGSIIGAITALIVVYLTILDNRKSRDEEYKLNNRALLSVTDTYSEDLRMNDLSYKFKGDKILLIESYEKKLKEEYTGRCGFITLTNCGPGIIVDGVFKIYFKINGNKNQLAIEIPIISKDERIHIPISQEEDGELEKIVLTYNTLGKEKTIFTRVYTDENGKDVIYENYKYELLRDDVTTKAKLALGWIYVQEDQA
ncbi:hypothetical protein RBU61_08340 [Tissierella sp. MB52-C2]|uniref:hypothetical protein n=1 Tax=Tissierella sp. MB52-C2 TaxID=3070999 RepID=UPI00280C209A|nr:hypothetical protein [Tissierella sp. MB52-C2]WMM26673.1 hypothetical protein RBU61_08340 [Tissierella sp. MB52-C2]